MFTPENVNDRKSLNQVGVLENIEGRLCANKGYIGQGVFENLYTAFDQG